MRQASGLLEVETGGVGLIEITSQVARWTGAQGMREGLLTLFCRHTSASLLIQENAAPDDMPAHIRAALTPVQLSVPLIDGRLALGTWQGLYLFEHRRRPHWRSVALHLLGE